VQKARSLVTLAQVARAQRRWKQAIDQFKEAVEGFRRAKLPIELGEAARELGMLLKERGEHAQAADYLAMAISIEAETRKRPTA
jgi:tetratricopeptide (TPR) repeat protein